MKATVWEIYFDREPRGLSNENFSWFIKSVNKPTPRLARKILTRAGKKIEKGYHVAFIAESTWIYNEIGKDIVKYE